MVGDAAAGRAWAGPCEVAVDVVPCGFYALVCDGMGGEVGGEIAATLACEVISGAMAACWTRFLADPARTVAAAEERLGRGMKTTVGFGSMFVAQVGDSRAYLLREGRLAQLTRDQTWAELVRSQSPAAAGIDPEAVGKNVILQAVGASAKLDVVLTRHELRAGDVVLLCSDGLSGPVDDAAIEGMLASATDLAGTCDALVGAANANGGPDNVSCVVIRVD